MPRNSGVVIQKLKLRAAGGSKAPGEVGILSDRALRVLRGAELHPPEMPPSAVLLVRRLETRVPDPSASPALGAGPAGSRTRGGAVDLAGWFRWESDVRRALSESAAGAIRPVRGEIPDDAAAVLFRDPAEMAAALLVDVARGEAAGRWWWQGAAVDPAALWDLSQAFVREPLLVPAAVSYLIAWRRAKEVALALSPGQALMLVRRLCSVYGLSRIAALLDSLAGDAARPGGGPAVATGPRLAAGRLGDAGMAGSGRSAAGGQASDVRTGERVEEGRRGREDFRASQGMPHMASQEPDPSGRPRGAGSHGPGAEVRFSSPSAGEDAGGTGAGRTALFAGAPWGKAAPGFAVAGSRIGKERAALFGIAAALARSPHVARTAEFASRFEVWWRHSQLLEKGEKGRGDAPGRAVFRLRGASATAGARSGPPTPAGSASRDARGGPPASRGLERGRDRARETPGTAGGGERPAAGPFAFQVGSGGGRMEASASGMKAGEAAGRSPGSAAASGDAPGAAAPEAAAGVAGKGAAVGSGARLVRPGIGLDAVGGAGAAPMADELAAGHGDPAEPWSSAPWCETELGGLLYLLNLMKRLKLPECFEADWRLESALGTWGCLQAIAIGLLATRSPELGPGERAIWSDPIWRLLAELEGREPGRPLGEGVVDPGALAVPPTWAEPAAMGASAGGGPAAREGGVPAAGESEVQTRPLPVTPPLMWWIECVTPYLAAYIKAAARPAGGDGLDPAELLFVRGRVYSSATHIDLVTDLEQISLAARVAGLDADPGWDPKAARVVQFHFR